MAWEGTKLTALDPEVVDKLRRKALSASTSKSMQSCVARWAGERMLDKQVGPFEAAPLGTAAHAVMEDLMGLEPSARTVERAEQLTVARGRALWPDRPEAPRKVREAVAANRDRWIREVFACWLGLFTIENPADVNVYAREMAIEGIVLNGVPTVGYIDRVEYGQVKGRPGLISVDYKSGKVPAAKWLRRSDDHGDQIRVYTAAIEHMTGEKPVGGRLYYTKAGVSREVDISAKAIDKTLAVFKSSWNKHNKYMDEGSFPTKAGPLCGWCPLVNACPVAHDAGLGPRIEGLPTAVQLGMPGFGPSAPASVPVPAQAPEAVPAAAAESPETAAARAASAESAKAFAAHIPVRNTTSIFREEEEHMKEIVEDKPWEPLTVNGELNPNSYGAMAVFGLTSLAVEQLHAAGIPLSKTYVTALAQTLHHVVSAGQEAWTGAKSLQDGANTRIRGALRTVIETLPLPFGQDEDAWTAWTEQAVRRVRSITFVALDLWTPEAGVRPSEPWNALASAVPAAPAKAAPKARRKPAASVPAAKPAPDLTVVPEPVPVAVQQPAPAPVPVRKPEPVEMFPDDDDAAA